MGEISDMMIDGTLDFYSGEYIGKGCGIPRTIDKSLPWEQVGRGHSSTFGVINFLSKKGIKNQDDIRKLLRAYAEHKKWEIQDKKFIRKISVKIQLNFHDFARWSGNYLKSKQQ